jgi:NAD(P)-dependent dehydrogenase (short-subunit alcohol dehydrogenase family)
MNLKELYNLKGSVAIITGGRTGLGLQMATGLAEAGANLVIASRNYNKCIEVCGRLEEKYKIKSMAFKLDVTKEKDIKDLINKTIEHYSRIDILVNNAGEGIFVDTIDTKLADWKYIMDLNVNGIFLSCREAGKHMIAQKYGKIINIASVYGIRGMDPKNYVEPAKLKPGFNQESLNYTASKGAVINLTRDLAANWAKHNITVNAISPGAFITESTKEFTDEYCKTTIASRIPAGRWGADDDLKGAIVFLSSNASKYVTGHNLVVDGGWSVWC